MKNDTRSRGIVTASAYLAIGLLVSCAVVAPTDNSPAFCTINTVQIHTDFEGASVQGCQQYEGGLLLTIAPAYTPVNPSPWYAYRLQTTTETRVTLTQQYLHGHHRYHPWVSQDGRIWQRACEAVARRRAS